MSTSEDVSRRAFLQRVGSVGLASVGASTLLTACGGGSGEQGGGGGQAASTQEACTDLSDVPESAKKMRASLNYVNDSPKPNQQCSNCQLYQPDKIEGTCGGCQLFAGPVHPEGYCDSWVKKQPQQQS